MAHKPPADPPFTSPAAPTFSRFGDTSRPWSNITRFFDDLAVKNASFTDLAEFARAVHHSPFPAAGLCGLTSMHDIYLGPSTHVLDNPHLRISYDFDQRIFSFEYRDGSRTPWKRTSSPADAFATLERFLTRRARWFHPTPAA